jgi:iron complex transport system substrate-binding protein
MNPARWRAVIGLALIISSACTLEPPPSPAADEAVFEGVAPERNLYSERVARYNAAADYFPEKVSFRHAKHVTVEYHRNFKLATIRLEGMGGQRQQVLMVQRGTLRPSGYADAELVWVPVRRWSAQNFHYGGAADLFGVADRIVSLGGSIRHATSPGIVRLIGEGRIRQHRSTEQAAFLEPEVFLSYTPYLATMKDHDQLRALGLTNLMPVERVEETPLGQSEWLKFFALLFNKEAEAEAYFTRIEGDYRRLAALTSDVRRRPRVFVDIPWSDGWQTPGGRNAAARIIADAGGEFVFAENNSVTNQLRNPIELAYDRGLDADVWLITDNFAGLRDLVPLLKTNPYTRRLPMLQREAVYLKHSGREGAPNPYFDLGLLYPHLDLADHIRILHPELMPDHDLFFHQSLASWIERSKEKP